MQCAPKSFSYRYEKQCDAKRSIRIHVQSPVPLRVDLRWMLGWYATIQSGERVQVLR